MNYQYIEQLIERYFECQTTLHEEQILRTFFAGEDVPGHLMPYAELFQYETLAKEEALGEDFDQKMLARIQEEATAKPQNCKTAKPYNRTTLAPFFRAAAVVAIILTIGSATDHALRDQEAEKNEAIDPYIRQANIQNAIRTKDISQAEAKPLTDSLLVQPMNESTQ
ncbi:MAG: pyruvate ferredoxin oxidoreductase [Bacteroidaceae bacterium]|nr:pyruvate ferredoxin oxidoreductase [Bacteroidaceae bacterium]